ncbi:MAG: hypothetical protein HY514_02860 [Candidatus Aenigmarchaeota archaeon]|nr:hypothetical protein [Candidatus Aenigmarchaeota archaeon]
MGEVARTRKFEERTRNALYDEMVGALQDGGIDYETIYDMLEEFYGLGKREAGYAFDDEDYSGTIEEVRLERVEEQAADVTIYYRNGTNRKFIGVKL